MRIFDAPRELVFACMTRPEHLTHFWGPQGTTAPSDRIHIELRPGGTFETVMVNDADRSEYLTRAIYLEIVEPELLVWKEVDSGMTVRITFAVADENRTQVRIRQSQAPEVFHTVEARAGFLTSLDRLDAHLRRSIGARAAGPVIDGAPRSEYG